MLSNNIQAALNDQMNLEFRSFYTYLAMSAYCEFNNFPGFAHWLRQQSYEEQQHGMKLYRFLAARGYRVNLDEMPKPARDYESVYDVFRQALEQEKHVSESINSLYKLAWKEEAFAALVELEWFIKEQVEEEQTARLKLAQLDMVKEDPAALLDLDRQMAERATEA